MKLFSFLCLLFLCAVSSLSAADLRLSEVFVDGTDERVEVANVDALPFVGSFQLSGVKSSLLSVGPVSIPSMQTLLVGDNLSMLSTSNSVSLLSGRGLSLGDTSSIDIQLIYDGLVMDVFQVDEPTIKSSDNKLTSFQKLYNNGLFDIAPSSSLFSYGVVSPFVANPGLIYTTVGGVRLPLSLSGDVGVDVASGSENQTTLSGDACLTDWSDVVAIDEIYVGDLYSHYIELIFLRDWVGSLSFSGSVLASGFVLPSQGYKANMRYIVAPTNSGFQHTNNIIIAPLSLFGSGMLDVREINSNLGYSSYVDTTGQSVYSLDRIGCIQQLTVVGNPSPGFDQQFLQYLNTSTVTHTVTETVSSACVGSSITTPSLSPTTGSLGTSFLSGFFNFHDVRISLIDYDPEGSDTNNERIGLTSSTGVTTSLSGWSLVYDGKSYKFLSGELLSGIEYIKTANFTFVNSRSVCVSLLYGGIVIDTACYDPLQNLSPYFPLLSGVVSSSNLAVPVINATQNYDDVVFDILSVVYDPDGNDTDRESVTIKLVSAATGVVLDDFRLRVGTTNKRIYGQILPGQASTLVGNFQMPNTKDTCVALTYGDLVYDEYCYSPISTTNTTTKAQEISPIALSGYSIRIQDLVYDPDGNDTDRESVLLLLTGVQSTIHLDDGFYLRFGTTKRYLHGVVQADTPIVITGNFQMPNSKYTCVDLMQGNYQFDSFCYDPVVITPSLTGTKTPLVVTGFSEVELSSMYSGLHLDWILPNPKGKDLKNTNEKIGLSFVGSDLFVFDKRFKMIIGKTSISLSGYVLSGQNLTILSPKSLSNQAACIRLLVGDYELDRICYPQAKDDVVYYHPRLNKGPQTIPGSLIDSLDMQGVDLSDLILKKIQKQVCLTYEGVSIRCMNGGTTSSTSAKNRALLTLGNRYISQVSTMVSSNHLDYVVLDQWSKSYHFLSQKIKKGKLSTIDVYGKTVPVTDIEGYVHQAYESQQEVYVTDQIARIFFGHPTTDEYYKTLY